MKVLVYVSNRFGGWTPAALAQRLGMTLVSTGDFAGMLSPDELAEVRNAGVTYTVNWDVVTTDD